MYSPFNVHSGAASAVSTGTTASAVIRRRKSSDEIPAAVIWVTAYGSSMVVSTPLPTPSAASDRPNASSPPLLAAYADSPMSPCPPVEAPRQRQAARPPEPPPAPGHRRHRPRQHTHDASGTASSSERQADRRPPRLTVLQAISVAWCIEIKAQSH